jgi:hypothetical protein
MFVDILTRYANFMRENWIWVGMLCIMLIALARTKMEMHWLDIWFTGIVFGLWFISESLKFFL